MSSSPDITRDLDAYEGAGKLLSECLSLSKGDVLTIFYDERTIAPATLIIEEANSLGYEVIGRFVPIDFQKQFRGESIEELRLEDGEAISKARAILSCLSDLPDCTPFRILLVRRSTDNGRRVGHIPGITMNMLRNAFNINYAAASDACEQLAVCLAVATKARLRTHDLNQTAENGAYDLEFDLGGLDRPPICSNGLIPRNTWGNLPAGEAFIAPIEGTAEGTFIVNGSFRGCVLTPEEHVKLVFSGGKIVSFNGNGESLRKFQRLIDIVRERDHDCYDFLAELGIGINDSIEGLTGNSLLDEKCAKTAHVAIGSNRGYGGRISSVIHEDFVTRRPSLWLDDRLVLDRGVFVATEREWQQALSDIDEVDRRRFSSATLISRAGTVVEIREDEKLRVRREAAAGRQCTYVVGRAGESRLLAQFYEMLPAFPLEIRVKQLLEEASSRLDVSDRVALSALSLLHEHRIVAVRE